ncbi:MAG TPA: DoxX family protein [Pseudonocardiaceae bacterium]|nr:DoxX family protein [Pseudonocardiaceae bacterium]
MTELDTVDIAAALLRVVVGLTLVAHGYNHLWGPGGLAGTTRWFGSLSLRPPKLHAVLSAAGELV